MFFFSYERVRILCFHVSYAHSEVIEPKNHALTKTQAHEMIRKLYGYGA